MSKFLGWLKRNLLSEALLLIMISGTAFAYFVVYPRVVAYTKSEDMKELDRVRGEAQILQDKLQNVEADRDNILEQTKGLLQEKAKWIELGEELEALRSQNEKFLGQKDTIHQENQKLKKELAEVADHFDRLKDAYQDIQMRHDKMDTENSKLRMLIGKTVEGSPQFQKLMQQVEELKAKNKSQIETIKDLQEKLKKVLLRVKKIQDRDFRFAKTSQNFRKNIEALSADKERLEQINKQLNQAVAEAPKHFTDMAKQNNSLVKETSDMHFNLAVLFMQNKNFDQAIREFRRALDFDPENARVHYNLGYLYAEEFQDHQEAISHFKKYLDLDPNSNQSESIKSYIMTWETFDTTHQDPKSKKKK